MNAVVKIKKKKKKTHNNARTNTYLDIKDLEKMMSVGPQQNDHKQAILVNNVHCTEMNVKVL